ncbi:MAG TPA: hypothetical protein VNZ44_12295, partial [Pyrinomonadaceae bacterium]|nr:hypothetical protein [Pyrinomonadaceae bacterium]
RAGVVSGAGASGARPERPGRASGRARASGAQPFHVLSNAVVLLVVGVAAAALITPPSFRLAFYGPGDLGGVEPVLRYAREHRDGRYMVETPPFSDTETAHEGRAIGAYLAAQGNEVTSVFFREASPSIIFFNSLVRSLSVYGDATNISSVLIDDKDFVEQPVARHLAQARLLGVRYLVIRSPWARNRLDGQPDIKARADFGPWSVYELGGEPFAPARALAYKPALVVSGFSVKQRRRDQYEFVRLAEEQFADGWYDVLLARSPETRLDRVDIDEGFGAVVVDTYDCDDEDAAFRRLGDYSRRHTLILLSADAPLFRRIKASPAEFANAVIIERPEGGPGGWLEAGPPTRSYEADPVRSVWREIRKALDEHKVAAAPEAAAPVAARVGERSIEIEPRATPAAPLPVLVSTTYFPHWRREDGKDIYAATPLFMLTFVREPTRMVFTRRPFDRLGAAVSAATFLLVCAAGMWPWRKIPLRALRGEKPSAGVGAEVARRA